MNRTEDSHSNLLLYNLPAEELSKVVSILRPTPLIRKKIVYRIGDPISLIYFPCGGLVSEIAILADGGGLEVMTIGREGAFGINALFGPPISPHEVTIQMSGAGWSVPLSAFKHILSDCPVLADRLCHYFSSWYIQVSQIAACTGRHTVPQRCASKLLTASERSGSVHLPLTHENLAHVLGVRRAGITNAISALEKDGAIQCMRGSIEILNMEQLKVMACECGTADSSIGALDLAKGRSSVTAKNGFSQMQEARWG